MNQDTITAIEEEIYQLRAKIAERKKQLRGLIEEMEKHQAERDKIHERIREIRNMNSESLEKAKKLREEINEIRSRIKSLTPELKKRGEEKNTLIQQLNSSKAVEGLSMEQVSQRIRMLEEKIETGPLRPEEERRCYEEIKRLTRLLSELRRREELANKLKNVKDEASAIWADVKSLREMLSSKLEELKSVRENIQRVWESVKELKPLADQHHSQYLEYRQKSQMVEAEIILLSSRILELQDLVRKHKEEQAKSRENELKERVKSRALQKISAGGKLSFEEMRLLLEDEASWKLLEEGGG
ncbi:Chromosome partition protein Smc [archaeon HR01]|nr:Chromosome partition protein Smc [archaeon HR01]